MTALDLDALKAARVEAEGGEPKHLLLGGQKFELPPELPWDFGVELAAGRTNEALEVLLNGQYAEFMKLQPSRLDIMAIMENLDDLYPDVPGEGSSASSGKSRRTTARPRPTSSATTD